MILSAIFYVIVSVPFCTLQNRATCKYDFPRDFFFFRNCNCNLARKNSQTIFMYVMFLWTTGTVSRVLFRKRELLSSARNSVSSPGNCEFALGTQIIVVIRARQRSGEGVVRRNGCPKGCFWRVRFFSAPLRFSLKTPERS